VFYGCCEKKKEKRNLFLSLFEKNEMFMMNVNIHQIIIIKKQPFIILSPLSKTI